MSKKISNQISLLTQKIQIDKVIKWAYQYTPIQPVPNFQDQTKDKENMQISLDQK